MSCACKDCVSRARPKREEMTLIYGDADREIRAVRLHHMLVIEAYDSDNDGGWTRDREYGVAVSEPGFEALRKLLAENHNSTPGYGATGTATLGEVQPDAE